MPLHLESRLLLLDTCVVEYLLDKYMNSAVSEYISDVTTGGPTLGISEIVYAELVDGAHKEKVEQVKTHLDTYTRIEVNKRVLIGSGVLSKVYAEKLKKTCGASFQDKVIAATAFVYNLPILTADVLDFPHPFFTTLESKGITYRKKNKDHYICLDVLQPNPEALTYWYSKTK